MTWDVINCFLIRIKYNRKFLRSKFLGKVRVEKVFRSHE
jgi:hypothetical protein